MVYISVDYNNVLLFRHQVYLNCKIYIFCIYLLSSRHNTFLDTSTHSFRFSSFVHFPSALYRQVVRLQFALFCFDFSKLSIFHTYLTYFSFFRHCSSLYFSRYLHFLAMHLCLYANSLFNAPLWVLQWQYPIALPMYFPVIDFSRIFSPLSTRYAVISQ